MHTVGRPFKPPIHLFIDIEELDWSAPSRRVGFSPTVSRGTRPWMRTSDRQRP